eukprot:COSAG06_NODE_16858_length_977_cov_0.796128_1_plen_58_part_00
MATKRNAQRGHRVLQQCGHLRNGLALVSHRPAGVAFVVAEGLEEDDHGEEAEGKEGE